MDQSDSGQIPALPCADKISFDTKKEADAAATVAQYRYGGSLAAYKCRHCGLWHLATRYDD